MPRIRHSHEVSPKCVSIICHERFVLSHAVFNPSLFKPASPILAGLLVREVKCREPNAHSASQPYGPGWIPSALLSLDFLTQSRKVALTLIRPGLLEGVNEVIHRKCLSRGLVLRLLLSRPHCHHHQRRQQQPQSPSMPLAVKCPSHVQRLF